MLLAQLKKNYLISFIAKAYFLLKTWSLDFLIECLSVILLSYSIVRKFTIVCKKYLQAVIRIEKGTYVYKSDLVRHYMNQFRKLKPIFFFNVNKYFILSLLTPRIWSCISVWMGCYCSFSFTWSTSIALVSLYILARIQFFLFLIKCIIMKKLVRFKHR